MHWLKLNIQVFVEVLVWIDVVLESGGLARHRLIQALRMPREPPLLVRQVDLLSPTMHWPRTQKRSRHTEVSTSMNISVDLWVGQLARRGAYRSDLALPARRVRLIKPNVAKQRPQCVHFSPEVRNFGVQVVHGLRQGLLQSRCGAGWKNVAPTSPESVLWTRPRHRVVSSNVAQRQSDMPRRIRR